jgi:S1-C subfamily serine protease
VPSLAAIDVLLALLLLAGLLSGLRQGAIVQAGGLIGAGACAVLAVIVLPEAAALLPPLDRYLRAVLVIAVLVAALALGQGTGGLLAVELVRRLGRGALRQADRVAGAVLGGAQVVLLIWFVAPILAAGPSPVVADQIDRSAVVAVIHRGLPAPGPVLGRLRAFLDPAGLPQVFELFEAPGGAPVSTPAPEAVQAIGRGAAPSTVEVTGVACGMRVTGTGFVVSPGYVVTNAHVVAGQTGRPHIAAGGDTASATVVLFDPGLDVALLEVPGLALPALALDDGLPGRGDTGAALGHPNGGDLALIPAAVRDVFSATGFDIYGRAPVTRVVIELAADVTAGDSGGPFVGTDGRVEGVIFARARTGAGTGYALGMPEVRAVVDPAIGRSDPVDTGDCLP